MKNIAIYLAGAIQKGHEKLQGHYWTEEDIEVLRKNLTGLQVSFLNPAWRTDDLADQHSVFGRDMLQVYSSDVVFVDARDRRGLGVGAEMMWAKCNAIPVITLAPKDSHYHKSHASVLGVEVEGWIHPFVESLSDCVAENLAEGARWITAWLENQSTEKVVVKDAEFITDAMRHYCATQFQRDQPMRELVAANESLQIRFESVHK